ncbi:UNKNOWN [Stylonychia lemnae]|uniref:Inhibitor of growth protein n=1 Tax=Stylonychia lemnae TaxID=5949 RepID=A0A078A1F7_STYLE|nr:UNKNOWN [Stylonychia lemnae]|eukprot:CDW76086.1 UNKNOWN [Stylonychia lemnae]
MSVIQELFENYDHIPVEFKRHLHLLRELDEQVSKLQCERDVVRKELNKKQILEDEEQRNRQLERLYQIHGKIDSIQDEKLEIAAKLFSIQQNFIRKLDQQIEKTEEDKNVQDKCNQDVQMDDIDLTIQAKNLKNKKTILPPGRTSNTPGFGKGNLDPLSQSFGELGQKRNKNDLFKYEPPAINNQGQKSKRDNFGPNSSSKRSNGVLGGNPFIPYSQDEGFQEGLDNQDDDSICSACNTRKQNENWIQCETCNKWFHQNCVGINQFNVPGDDESWHCLACRKSTGSSSGLKRGFSEFGASNLLEDV